MAKSKATAGQRLVALLCVLGGVALVTGAAQEPDNDFRFSLIGDRNGGQHQGIYPRVWREIDLLAPDFAINVGDTIEGYVKDSPNFAQEMNRQWDQATAVSSRYKQIPHLYTAGNHDIFNDASAPIYRERSGFAANYVYRHQNALFIFLDNSRTNDLSEDQYAYLEEQLKANPQADPTFVLFHRPFWIGPVNARNVEFRLHKICKQYGVDWVITGHGHQLTYRSFDGVEYLEVGSSGGAIGTYGDGRPMLDFGNGRFFHHLVVRVRGRQVRMAVKEISGAAGDGRLFDLTAWDGTKPLFNPGGDPYEGEQRLEPIRIVSPVEGATVPRGTVPIISFAANPADRASLLYLGDQELSWDPSGFVVVAVEVDDLHGSDSIDHLLVNGEVVCRLSPEKYLTGWSRLYIPVPRALWERATPAEVMLTAGTKDADGRTGDVGNHDDYRFRNLVAYDGQQMLHDPLMYPNTPFPLGDNKPELSLTATARMTEAPDPAPFRLRVHTWNTTGLAAGQYPIRVQQGRAEAVVNVKVD